jgi:hypothetical protein
MALTQLQPHLLHPLFIAFILRHIDLHHNLVQLGDLRGLIIHELAIAGYVDMSQSNYSGAAVEPLQKQRVVSFLRVHLEHGGIHQQGHDALYHMVMLITAIGKGLHTIVQSKIAAPATLRRMEWHATCVQAGCEMFKQFMEDRLQMAQHATKELPSLEDLGSVEELREKLGVWKAALR